MGVPEVPPSFSSARWRASLFLFLGLNFIVCKMRSLDLHKFHSITIAGASLLKIHLCGVPSDLGYWSECFVGDQSH